MTLLFLFCALLPVEESYRAGDYERVVELAPNALAEPGMTRTDSVRVNTFYGSSLVALGRTQEAARVFRSLLEAEPDLVLAPERFSPKIRQVFQEVKDELHLRRGPETIVRTDTVFVRPRPSIALLAPGLFQVQNRRPAKGYALLGIGVLSIAGAVASHLAYNDAHREYLAASTPAEIADTYRTANTWHRTRFVFSCTAAGTWLFSLVDGLLGL